MNSRYILHSHLKGDFIIMNILVVKANNRPSSEGISSKMYETFMENIEGANVTTFDVFAEDMPYFGQDLFNAFGKVQSRSEEHTSELQSRFDLVCRLLLEIKK